MQGNRGFGTVLFLLLLVAAVIGIIYGYFVYTESKYIALHDGEMTRYLDVPPYSKRTGPPTLDLKGTCLIEIGITPDQANTFFGSMSSRRGFVFRSKEKESEIEFEIRPNYLVKGKYHEAKLSLSWTPILSEKLLEKFQKVFPGDPLPGAASGAKKLDGR